MQDITFGTKLFSGTAFLAIFGTSKIRLTKIDESNSFSASSKKQLQGVLGEKTFMIFNRSSVPKGTLTYRSRFVDYFTTVDNKTFPKSTIIAQNYMNMQS